MNENIELACYKTNENDENISEEYSLMDEINRKISKESENIALMKNVFNVMEDSKVGYLNFCKTTDLLQLKPRIFDMENGLGLRRQSKLNPSFNFIENGPHRDTFCAHYVEPEEFSKSVTESIDINLKEAEKYLDISLEGKRFSHHHEFSLEKILSFKLEDYYEKYLESEKQLLNITHSIDINRQTRSNLKEKLKTISPNKKDLRFDETILKYTETVIELKEKYFKEMKHKKELTNTLLSLWSDIQNTRHKSKVVCTPLVLDVQNIYSEDEFVKEWNNIFQTEYSDMLIKLEYNYVAEYLLYKNNQKLESGSKVGEGKLKPKLIINPDEIKVDVEEIVNFLISPKDVALTLKYCDEKSYKDSNYRVEYETNDKTIYFKLYVDTIFVCESDHLRVSDLAKVDFNDSLTLQILPDNKVMTIILNEDDTDVAEFSVNLKEIPNKSPACSKTNFVYNDTIVTPSAYRVGSGFSVKEIAAANKVRLKSSNLFKGKLYTTLETNLKLAWNSTLNPNQASGVRDFYNIGRQIQRIINGTSNPSLHTVLDLINNIYDCEIKDERVVNAIKNVCKSRSLKIDTIFDDSLDVSRYELLRLRNNGRLIGNKAIPVFQSQLSTEQLNQLQNNGKDFDVEYIESKRMDPIHLQRYIGAKFVEKLNEKLLVDLHEKLLQKTHKGVVMDYQDLSLRSMFSNKSKLSLGTSSYLSRRQSIEEGLIKEQELHITILRAYNLFDRCACDEENQDHTDYIDLVGYKIRPLRPYVRVSYNGESVHTPTAIGSHPSWNCTIKIKTAVKPLSLIHIDIYDEYKENPSLDPEGSGQSFRYRCYNKWLGTIAIPIKTIMDFGSVRGTFKIKTPPTIFGYENAAKETTPLLPEIKRLMRKDAAFLTFRITTSLSHLGGLQHFSRPIDADDPIIKHLNNFTTEYLNDFPTRNISLTFIDSAGRNKCVTEFIQALPLPEITLPEPKSGKSSKRDSNEEIYDLNGDLPKMMDVVVRYVSLIPTYDVNQSHVVTLLGVELLKVLYGSPLDHTLLLASYFISMGVKCWVVIGTALPRGFSSYVLIKCNRGKIIMDNDRDMGYIRKETEVYIFDAVGGDRYDVRDVGCPLKTVSYVFDNENIWVNVQSCQDCESLSFDFTNSSNWTPVFNKSIFIFKQPDITTNVYNDPGDIEDLRSNLEAKIKGKIQKWRWNIKTIWNRYLSNLLRETLPHWEYWSFHPNTAKPTPGNRLSQILQTYKVFGFPLNMPYLSTKGVISRVKSTLLHLNDDPNAEFALAVEVFAYPNNVLSVWVFLASVARK